MYHFFSWTFDLFSNDFSSSGYLNLKFNFSLHQRTLPHANYLKGKKWQIKTKGFRFPPVSDTDVAEPRFYFNVQLRTPCQQFLIFLNFYEHSE